MNLRRHFSSATGTPSRRVSQLAGCDTGDSAPQGGMGPHPVPVEEETSLGGGTEEEDCCKGASPRAVTRQGEGMGKYNSGVFGE